MDEVPLYPHALIGFRSFRMSPQGLCAIAAGAGRFVWAPGENQALCLSRGTDHLQGPDPDCECGFYGLYDVERIKSVGECITGAIVGHGRVELHGDGFRAEWAEVVALLRPRQWKMRKRARQLARIYWVPLVRSERELAAVAAARGHVLDPSQRPLPPSDDRSWCFGFTPIPSWTMSLFTLIWTLALCAWLAMIVTGVIWLVSVISPEVGDLDASWPLTLLGVSLAGMVSGSCIGLISRWRRNR